MASTDDILTAAIGRVIPRMRQPTRPRTVLVHHNAAGSIRREISDRFAEAVETGGALIGEITDTAVTITRATVFDDSNSHTARSHEHISFSLAELDDPGVIGLWHSHTQDDPSPSHGDLVNWREILYDLQREHLVAVITAAGSRWGWASGRHTSTAYLVQRTATGDVTYEPAALRGLA